MQYLDHFLPDSLHLACDSQSFFELSPVAVVALRSDFNSTSQQHRNQCQTQQSTLGPLVMTVDSHDFSWEE